MAKIHCGTIDPNRLKIAGKPNRAMTPELKAASIWIDRKNDYRRHKEKQKIRHYSDEYRTGGFFISNPTAREMRDTLEGSLKTPLNNIR